MVRSGGRGSRPVRLVMEVRASMAVVAHALRLLPVGSGGPEGKDFSGVPSSTERTRSQEVRADDHTEKVVA